MKKEKSTNKITQVKKLVHKLLPTIYLKDNKVISKTSDSIEKVVTDLQSIDLMVRNSGDYQNARIIIIEIYSKSQLKSEIDFSVFEKFQNLKYIYINSKVKSNKNEIADMCKNIPTKLIVTYGINIPS